MIADSTLNEDDLAYYSACRNITLEWQVRNRYFVTASNASKLFFLKDAVIRFLQYAGKRMEIGWRETSVLNSRRTRNWNILRLMASTMCILNQIPSILI